MSVGLVHLRRCRALLCAVLAVSCSDGTGPVLPVGGTWRGTADGYILRFTVVQDDGVLRGYGSLIHLTFPESPYNTNSYDDVVGTYSGPRVSLTFAGGGNPTRTFEGKVGRSSMTGVLATPAGGLVQEFTLEPVCLRYQAPDRCP